MTTTRAFLPSTGWESIICGTCVDFPLPVSPHTTSTRFSRRPSITSWKRKERKRNTHPTYKLDTAGPTRKQQALNHRITTNDSASESTAAKRSTCTLHPQTIRGKGSSYLVDAPYRQFLAYYKLRVVQRRLRWDCSLFKVWRFSEVAKTSSIHNCISATSVQPSRIHGSQQLANSLYVGPTLVCNVRPET